MHINELYEKYPLSMAKYEETIPLLKGIDPSGRRVVTQAFLTSNPRSLYELFDKEHMMITIGFNNENDFSYDIYNERDYSLIAQATGFSTRVKAETAAFEVAFNKMELNQNH